MELSDITYKATWFSVPYTVRYKRANNGWAVKVTEYRDNQKSVTTEHSIDRYPSQRQAQDLIRAHAKLSREIRAERRRKAARFARRLAVFGV